MRKLAADTTLYPALGNAAACDSCRKAGSGRFNSEYALPSNKLLVPPLAELRPPEGGTRT
jgi:hypothetical protein